ncbi:ABC transporter permease [Bacillus sonorensis]|uniref:Dipeptide/oligopeptide ABC transporter permease n=2 Tax=Bacillus sonorensis TaxID=119858 RepID=M5P060_9BACI|nr:MULTISPECIES: ABC transporter permease [Bacillus]TWK77051.1 Dipeptide transport system permease protein DppB [Bacillus paralicheniformis]ASB87646.1 Oligopeptide transport system permease protein AppB [Bacillus sonorensis]EME72844.1 dipeptide/oligopeptide ABC transporter permease [Bacillus sonorensis L12]MBG9916413.1 peptide ABC transporter permease [Bacillus sonorensis]MCF7617095.1 ABC transporter permease [Bacillus sonorensis]
MLAYCLKRTVMLIPVLIGMTLVVFSIIRFIPGNPAQVILGQRATKEAVQQLTVQLGLDQPWYIQYGRYIGDLLRGDLGTSIRTGAAITKEMQPYLFATLELAFFAMMIAVLIGVNAGMISAWFKNSVFDYTAMLIALIGVSMPIFWLGLMGQWFFSIELGWLPTTGRENVRNPVEAITYIHTLDTLLQGRFDQFGETIRHLILPATALATIPAAIIARITRASMIEVLQSDYIRTAKAKGVHMFSVVYKHGLKNAFIPILTVIGLQTGLLLGGAILTETIFAWPGIGRYIYDAISYRDYPVIQSGILMIAFIFVMINFIVDLLYAVIDPRIKY